MNKGWRLSSCFKIHEWAAQDIGKNLLAALRSDTSNIKTLALELFEPATREFLESLASIRERVTLTISPESGVESVRKGHGRTYTNEQILSTANLCRKLGLSLTVFFMIGLAGETHETLEQTERLWEQLYKRTESGEDETRPVVKHGVSPMILLDPGSLAFDHPEEYGYKLRFKKLSDYVQAMTRPSWHQWISYETRELNTTEIANITLLALEESIRVREKHGVYKSSPEKAEQEYFVTRVGREIIASVDEAMGLKDEAERLNVLARTLSAYPWVASKDDPYGYSLAIRTAMMESVGLLDATC